MFDPSDMTWARTSISAACVCGEAEWDPSLNALIAATAVIGDMVGSPINWVQEGYTGPIPNACGCLCFLFDPPEVHGPLCNYHKKV